MDAINRLTLRQKLWILLIVLISVAVLVGGIGIVKLREVSNAQREMYVGTVVPLRKVVDGGRQAAVHFRRMYPYILKTDPKAREETLTLNNNSEADVLKAIDFLQKDAPTPELRETGAKLATVWAEYKDSVKKLYALADNGTPDLAMGELNANTDRLHVKVRNLLLEAGKFQEEHAKQTTEKVAKTVDDTGFTISLIIVLSAIFGVALGTVMIRVVTKQLGGDPSEASHAAQMMAQGDLAFEIKVAPQDTTSLMANLSLMQLQLSTLIQRVRESAEIVSQASGEISAGTNDLSSRTEQQAAALEETATATEELGSTAAKNADNARSASQVASGASSVAIKAGEVVSEVVTTMKGIQESSVHINDIIGVIDSIAFQTNILALNAAVEAARAGEQGRGFAVVAAEVRALAQRSSSAAKEIKDLIHSSGEKVSQGTGFVDKAGVTMVEVVEAIQKVSALVAEIASASGEQSAGANQIGDAISRLDEATQQNAALVEESAAASASLKAQASQLVDAISVFRIRDNRPYSG